MTVFSASVVLSDPCEGPGSAACPHASNSPAAVANGTMPALRDTLEFMVHLGALGRENIRAPSTLRACCRLAAGRARPRLGTFCARRAGRKVSASAKRRPGWIIALAIESQAA